MPGLVVGTTGAAASGDIQLVELLGSLSLATDPANGFAFEKGLTHMRHIHEKVGLTSRAGLALFAVEHDLLNHPAG